MCIAGYKLFSEVSLLFSAKPRSVDVCVMRVTTEKCHLVLQLLLLLLQAGVDLVVEQELRPAVLHLGQDLV